MFGYKCLITAFDIRIVVVSEKIRKVIKRVLFYNSKLHIKKLLNTPNSQNYEKVHRNFAHHLGYIRVISEYYNKHIEDDHMKRRVIGKYYL